MDRNYIKEILEIKEASGLSQAQLAQELGVTFATLNRWLNLHATPHPNMRKAIHALHKDKVGIIPLPGKEISNALALLNKEKKKHRKIIMLLMVNRQLRDDLLLELTYNSNAIEGSTLTKKETESVIFDKAKLPDHSYVEHLEATNHASALNMIFDGEFKGKITEGTIKELHRIVMQGIRPDAGKYSRHQRAIRGVDLRLPAPEDIQEEMDYLFKRINKPKAQIVAHISKMHASFEAIHPFGDGNGRVGRLVMIIQLLQAGYAPCVIENNRKADYYEALEYAQRKSETHLTLFLTESIQKGFAIFRKHRK